MMGISQESKSKSRDNKHEKQNMSTGNFQMNIQGIPLKILYVVSNSAYVKFNIFYVMTAFSWPHLFNASFWSAIRSVSHQGRTNSGSRYALQVAGVHFSPVDRKPIIFRRYFL